MATEVGKGYVEVTPDFKNFGSTVNSEMSAQQGAFKKFGTQLGDSFKGAASTALAGFAAAAPAAIAVGVGLAVKSSITAATDLNEQLSKTDAVFGTSADTIVKWASTASTSFGQSKTQALEAASSFGNMFLQLGIGADQATNMSMSMTELATDFASFFNTNPADALDAIAAAFRGEYDAVQRFVPTINAAAVEQKALEMGLAATTKELTAQDKALAAYELIMTGAGEATGDFDKTSDSLANRQRILAAQIKDLSASFGQSLIPVLTDVAGIMTEVIGLAQGLGAGFEAADKKSGGWLNTLKQSAIEAINPVEGVRRKWDELFGSSDKATEGVENVTAAILDGKDGVAGYADAVAQGVGVMSHFGATADSVAQKLDRNVEGMLNLGASADAVAQNIGNEADVMRDLAAAADEAFNAQLALIDSSFAMNRAQQDVLESQTAANEAMANGELTALEQTIAVDEAVQANLKLAAIHGDVAESSGTAEDGQKAFIDTLRYLSGTASPEVRTQLEGVITKLEETGNQHPEPDVTLNDQASEPIRTLQDRIRDLDGASASIVVHAEAANARAALDGIIERANRINGMRIVAGVGAGLAEGIRNFRGGIALVGEEGPEIVHIPRGSDVYTNAESKALMSSRAAIYAADGIGPRQGVTIINQGTFLGTEEAFGKLADRAIAQARRAGNRAA